jgi:glutaconate CoA-transferase subunit B
MDGFMSQQEWTPDEIMTIVAARQFRNRATCFVGVGAPSMAACLARLLDAPDIVLMYESGTIGAKPTTAPLSIADSELAETADVVVPVTEFFSYWLQGGRIDMTFLGTAQIDRFGNLNTTVTGNYERPKVRLPGAGGAPEVASLSKEVFVITKHTLRAFVEKVDFTTTFTRKNLSAVVTDLGVLKPDPETGELVLVACHPGVSVQDVQGASGWNLRVAAELEESVGPTASELAVLRDLELRTRRAHEFPSRLP